MNVEIVRLRLTSFRQAMVLLLCKAMAEPLRSSSFRTTSSFSSKKIYPMTLLTVTRTNGAKSKPHTQAGVIYFK